MSAKNNNNIFERILSGEVVPFSDPEYYKLPEQSERAIAILVDFGPCVTQGGLNGKAIYGGFGRGL